MEQRLHAKCIRGPQKGTLIPPFRYPLSGSACCCCHPTLTPQTTVATGLPSSRRGSIAAPTLRSATFSFSNGAFRLPLGPFSPFQRPRVRALARVLTRPRLALRNRLKLKTIISLLPGEPSDDLKGFCKQHNITCGGAFTRPSRAQIGMHNANAGSLDSRIVSHNASADTCRSPSAR
jgi:hypothetical protein